MFSKGKYENENVYLLYTEYVNSDGDIDEWVHNVFGCYDSAVEYVQKKLDATEIQGCVDCWQDSSRERIRYRICEEPVFW